MDITVQGEAFASFPPERATLHLQLGFESDDKLDAIARTTALGRDFVAEVERLKAAEPSPLTWSAVLPISTRSWRPYAEDGRLLPLRHAAHLTAKLKFSDFKALSAFIDQWGAVEGVTIHWVEWTLTEAHRTKEEADVLGRAVEAARERALIMAKAAGTGQVRFIEIADEGLLSRPESAAPQAYGAAMRSSMMMKDSAGGDGVDLTPENVELSARIHARFTTD